MARQMPARSEVQSHAAGGAAAAGNRPAGVAFERSTQFRCWTFTPEQLGATREAVHRRAVETLLARQQQQVQGGQGPAASMGAGTSPETNQSSSEARMSMSPRVSTARQPGTPTTQGVKMEMASPLPQKPKKMAVSPAQQQQQAEEANGGDGDSGNDKKKDKKKKKKKKKKKGQPLTLEEEEALKFYYEVRIRDTCNKFKSNGKGLPDVVTGTAVTFFKRYFVRNSVMDQNPEQIMCSCIYLASKVEEKLLGRGSGAFGNIVATSKVYEKIKDPEERANLIKVMLNLEVPLLGGLRFHLRIYHPFRALAGLVLKMKEAEVAIPDAKRREVLGLANTLAKHAYYSDAVLLFTPAQLALAALLMASKRMGSPTKDLVAAFAMHHVKETAGEKALPEVSAIIARAEELLVTTEARLSNMGVAVSAAVAAEKKRKKCRNPLRDPTSDEYKQVEAARKAELARRRQEKHARQREERERATRELLMGPTTGNGNHDDDDGGFSLSRKRTSGSSDTFVLSRKRLKQTPDKRAN